MSLKNKVSQLLDEAQAIREAEERNKRESQEKWEKGGIDRAKANLDKLEEDALKQVKEKVNYLPEYRFAQLNVSSYCNSGREWLKKYFEGENFKVSIDYIEPRYDCEMGNIGDEWLMTLKF